MIKMMRSAFAVLLAFSSLGALAETASVAIRSSPVVQRPIRETLTVYGQVQADPDATLTVSLSHAGLITAVAARLGQRVKRGDTLLAMTTAPAARTQYLQGRSAVDYAQSELQRQEQLLREQLTTRAQVDGARKALADARSTLQALEAQGTGKAVETLYAPTAGIITALNVKQGDRVAADAAALAIASRDRLIAVLGVEPEDVGALGPGTPVTLRSVFVPGYQAQSRISEVFAMIDPGTRLVDVLAPIPAAKAHHLVLGSALIADLELSEHRGLTVPRSAVLQDECGHFVFRVVDGKARRVAVAIGIEGDTWIEITQGLKLGESVVSTGNYELRDGMTVREAR